MSRSYFQNIGGGDREPANVPEAWFRSWRKRECSDQEYHIGTASWVAENVFKYPPREYPALPGFLKSYSERRIAQNESRNTENASKIGQWVFMTVKYQSENQADLELLAWCREKCDSAKMTGMVQRLQSQILEFGKHRFPITDFQIASKALRKDSEERRNLGGNQ
jgi:hypothetical protein